MINKHCREIAGFATDGRYHFNIINNDLWSQKLPQGDPSLADLEDGTHHYINIFGHYRINTFEADAIYSVLPEFGFFTSNDEGCIFHRIYDENGCLIKVKIYVQEHRDRLVVKTVNITQLLERLRTLSMPSQQVVEKPTQMMSSERFSELITQFNEKFGHCVLVANYVNGSNDEEFELYFIGDNSVVENKLRILASNYGLEIDDKMCIFDGSRENMVGAFGMLEKIGDEYIQSKRGHYIKQPPHLTLQVHKKDSTKLMSLVAEFIISDERGN